MSFEKYCHGSHSAGWMEEQVAHVMVDGNWIPMRDTTFLNIEEDIHGQDIVTFEYKNEIKQSLVTFKYIN